MIVQRHDSNTCTPLLAWCTRIFISHGYCHYFMLLLGRLGILLLALGSLRFAKGSHYHGVKYTQSCIFLYTAIDDCLNTHSLHTRVRIQISLTNVPWRYRGKSYKKIRNINLLCSNFAVDGIGRTRRMQIT